jgi:hypothetical protein
MHFQRPQPKNDLRLTVSSPCLWFFSDLTPWIKSENPFSRKIAPYGFICLLPCFVLEHPLVFLSSPLGGVVNRTFTRSLPPACPSSKGHHWPISITTTTSGSCNNLADNYRRHLFGGHRCGRFLSPWFDPIPHARSTSHRI